MTLIVNDTKYKIDFTFAMTVTLMLLLCSEETVIISVISSALHEMGHLIMMQALGQKVVSVTFGAFGVRINRQFDCSLNYKNEALIAGGGILVNFVVAITGILYYYFTGGIFGIKLTAVNIFIAAFNMIPIDALDMGRVLRYTLLCSSDEDKCDRVMSIISALFVNLLAGICIIYTIYIGFNLSLITVTIYLYVITLFKKWS